ncbi:UNVERIFIED_CONTAM: hypothetical protein Slati_3247800 [Sesamum latifolium]|uniref:Uncharacterized protein n=1 Tax=Sesamum latifolium TaxID=2727402 RepID=A0AAW2V058_9LAMI
MELELPQVLDPNVDHDQTPPPASVDYRSNVDTSRPFRSVKEAVAVFGERFLAGEIYTPKPFSFPRKETPFFAPSPVVEREPQHWSHSSSSPRGSSSSNDTALSDTVKKLEAELENTKAELKLLKERESETEVALASLNAEVHKNMSKLALAEAAVAARAAGRGGDGVDGAMIIREEEKKRDAYLRMEWCFTKFGTNLEYWREGRFVCGEEKGEEVRDEKEAYCSSYRGLVFKEKGNFFYYSA